jgi:uncharacterized Zn-binding protein involved in type VI secretion
VPKIARKNDRIVGLDTHIVLLPAPTGKVPTPMPMPFSGPITDALAATVFADGKPVALVGSKADNSPGHTAPGGDFMKTPDDKATVSEGSGTVKADGKAVARVGDAADSCDDMGATKSSHIVASGSTTCTCG